MTTPWLAPNPRADRSLAFGRAQRFVVNPNGIPELLEELGQCPAHRVTPLHNLPDLAARLGVGEVRVKDESQRFGFGAFKALGLDKGARILLINSEGNLGEQPA